MSRSRSYPGSPFTRMTQAFAVVLVAAAAFACSDETAPTAATDGDRAVASGAGLANSSHTVPILAEPLTMRHTFTDDVATHFRVKPDGRSTEVINLKDASNTAVIRFTVQPGVRFPWHSHPGLVVVSVTQGHLNFVYADDCLVRPYPAGTAFVDPGFGNTHYAFNPTAGETVIVATFFGVPAAPAPLTNAVDAATSATLDAKCQVAAAMAHNH
jgi:hypothetical protein